MRQITGNLAQVFPELALVDDTIWSQARGLAGEAAHMLTQSIPWQTPLGYDRNATLARYPWGTYGFYGQLVAVSLGGPMKETLPRAFHFQAVLAMNATLGDMQLHAAMVVELAHALGRVTGTADVIEHALHTNLTERTLGIQAEENGPVVAHAKNYVLWWPVNAPYLQAHPELAQLRKVL